MLFDEFDIDKGQLSPQDFASNFVINFYTDDYVRLNPQVNAASRVFCFFVWGRGGGGEVLFNFSCMWTLLMLKSSCSLPRTQNYQKNGFIILFLGRSVEKNEQVIDR